MSLISLADLKIHLTINAAESNADPKLLRYIAWASKEIISWCRQPLLQCEKTIVFSAFYSFGQKTHTLNFLNNKVEKVAFYSRESPDDEWEVNEDIKLLNEGPTPQLYLKTGFIEAIDNYKAVLKVGFTLADAEVDPPVLNTIPEDIERVVVEMCRELAMESGLIGDEKTFKVGSITVAFNGTTTTKSIIDVNPRWRQALRPYRAPIL